MAEIDQSIALPAHMKLEQYTLTRVLSVGGFGVVYLAEDSEAGDTVAIKEFFPSAVAMRAENGRDVMPQSELDEDLFAAGLKCFFEEARLLSTIKHPNVVNVRNFFRAHETVYMVMDYYDGHGLDKELMQLKGQMSERRIRTLFAHIAFGLREVHMKRMLHLDIKPANIYLPKYATPIILDFGAARQSVQVDGRHLVGMYTPGFAAPEQYRGVPIAQGPWTDVYALGATMYAAMARATPVPADRRAKEDTLISASERFAGSYSKELLQLIDGCMVMDIKRRIGSMNAVVKALLTRPTVWGSAREKTEEPEETGFLKKIFKGKGK